MINMFTTNRNLLYFAGQTLYEILTSEGSGSLTIQCSQHFTFCDYVVILAFLGRIELQKKADIVSVH